MFSSKVYQLMSNITKTEILHLKMIVTFSSTFLIEHFCLNMLAFIFGKCVSPVCRLQLRAVTLTQFLMLQLFGQ